MDDMWEAGGTGRLSLADVCDVIPQHHAALKVFQQTQAVYARAALAAHPASYWHCSACCFIYKHTSLL